MIKKWHFFYCYASHRPNEKKNPKVSCCFSYLIHRGDAIIRTDDTKYATLNIYISIRQTKYIDKYERKMVFILIACLFFCLQSNGKYVYSAAVVYWTAIYLHASPIWSIEVDQRNTRRFQLWSHRMAYIERHLEIGIVFNSWALLFP